MAGCAESSRHLPARRCGLFDSRQACSQTTPRRQMRPGVLVSPPTAPSSAQSRKRLSAAQRCNEDVLYEVFAHLPPPELASAALVCRSWLPCARHRLYTSILFTFGHRTVAQLADTLRTRPHIRSLVRRLEIQGITARTWMPELVDWVDLLPEYSLQSVNLGAMNVSQDFLRDHYTLLDSPAIRTVSHFAIPNAMFLNPDRFAKVMSMPNLEVLSMALSNTIGVARLPQSIPSYPRLRRLGIRSFSVPSTFIEDLLRALPSPLERFTLVAQTIEEGDVGPLCNGLACHAASLRHLAISGSRSNHHTFPVHNFLDDVVPHCASLETLFCACNTYSLDIFSRAPASLSSLILCVPWGDSFKSDEYAAALKRCRGMLPRLKMLGIMDHSLYRQRCGSIADVCQAEGITFRMLNNWYSGSLMKLL